MTIGSAALGVLIIFSVLRRTPTASLERIPNQNVLLITIDTLRGDALHSYGGIAASRRSTRSPPAESGSTSRTRTRSSHCRRTPAS